jgi:hypothetical protein
MTEPVTGAARPILMRRTLGTLVTTAALALTAGCGSGTTSSTAADPDHPSPDGPSAGPVAGAKVLPLISQTGGGGKGVSTHAVLLDSKAQVAAFTKQFRLPGLGGRVSEAAADAARSGHPVYGAVVAIGCDVPPGAVVELDAEGQVEITPMQVASPLPECLAPVTTVALATVPGAD